MSGLDLDDRYGRKRTPVRFAKYLIFALLFGALFTWLVWSATYHSNPTVVPNLISFKESNEKSMGIKFEITRNDPNQPIDCKLTAVDIDKYVVGEITYRIPAGDRHEVISTQIPTRAHSVSASVERCVAAL
jgi:hypothetical protein